MKKPRKSPLGFIKIVLLIPAVLLTLGLTTGMTPQQKTIKGKVILADTGKPATGASIVIRGGTVGTVVDIDGTFKLNVDGNPELVVSFVGYKTFVVKPSDIGNKPLKMEVEEVELDLESVSMEVKVDPSPSIIIKQKDGSDAQPIFVVDGKVVKEIDNLDPETIDNISVYKDSDSEVVKKYNATDGVVMITTKEGKKEVDESVLSTDVEVFYIVEDMPRFPGGLPALKTYIYSNLEYPEEVQDKEGEVVVQWKINTKGQVEDVKVLRSTNSAFDAEVIKVIQQMPVWEPGKQRGKPVSVGFSTQIQLHKDKK